MVRMYEISPTGWFAICGGRELPVERFSEDGHAMVVGDERNGRLVEARNVDGFVQIIRRGRFVSMVPETTGWRVGGKVDGAAWAKPVVAWMIGDHGVGVPLVKSEFNTEIEFASYIDKSYVLLQPGDDPSALSDDLSTLQGGE